MLIVSVFLHDIGMAPDEKHILAWKNQLPETEYDEELKEETGKVFNHTDFGNEIEGISLELPMFHLHDSKCGGKFTDSVIKAFLHRIRDNAKKAGAKVVYADCNKEDLCMSYTDMVSKVTPNSIFQLVQYHIKTCYPARTTSFLTTGIQ